MNKNLVKYVSTLCRVRMLFHNLSSGSLMCRKLSNKPGVDTENDQPIKYTSSAAGKYQARSSLKYESSRLRYEPEVIIVSLTVFLVYFLVLREENDIDEQMYAPLHTRISGLEELQLKTVIEHSNNGEEIAAARKRLQEIEKEKL